MTEDRVGPLLERSLTNLCNPRLKLGEISSAADRGMTVENVAVDGKSSLLS